MITNMIDGPVVEEIGRDDLLDDLFHNLLPQLLGGDVVRVLGGNDNGIDTEGDDCATFALVFDGHLGLGVRSEPGKSAPAGNGQSLVELVGKHNRKRHQFRGFRSRISKHDTLIAGTVALERAVVETLGDIGGLLFNSDKDVAGLVVETLLGVVVANLLDGLTDDLLVINLGLGANFTKDHDHSGFCSGLAGDL